MEFSKISRTDQEVDLNVLSNRDDSKEEREAPTLLSSTQTCNWERDEARTRQFSADSAGLQPLVGAGCIIGAADEVNGQGALEAPQFVPTRHELLGLAKVWARKAWELEFAAFVTETASSYDSRVISFAWRRVNRIASVLGEKKVDAILTDLREEILSEERTRGEGRDWKVFFLGSAEERSAYLEANNAQGGDKQ